MPRKTPPYRTLIFKKNYKTYEKFYEELKKTKEFNSEDLLLTKINQL